MPVTVLNEDSATIVSSADDQPRRFSWSAAFAGAFVAAGVTFLLLTLGSGVGLSMVTVRHATQSGAVTFLTLGAIYFLAAQAFGFAVGGHIVGRLIGPAVESSREEDFRAGTHGLVSWAIAVVATATILALSLLFAGTAATTGAANGALASSATTGAHGDSIQATTTSYWVDRLFRPASFGPSASLAGRRYAQNDTGATTDLPATNEPAAVTPSEAAASNSGTFMEPDSARTTPVTTAPLPSLRPLGADKAEAGRILTVGMANGERLPGEDRTRLAGLVSADTGLATGSAERRVDEVANRIHDDEVAAADAARKAAATASLWTALALLFGAVVAVFAAMSARWEDDREIGLRPQLG